MSKSTGGKFGNTMNFGSKPNNSSYNAKNLSNSGNFGDKKTNASGLGGKISNVPSYSGKSGSDNLSSTSSSGGKKNTTPSFVEVGGNSKSQKTASSGYTKPTTEKNYTAPSFMNRNSKKSSMTFGIIWLPTRKRNKMKDAYNPNNDKRDRYKERTPSMYNFMSGDSSDHQAFKKKEETDLSVPERTKVPVTMAVVVSNGLPPDIGGNIDSDEKQEFIQHDKEESKEAAGDSNEKSDKDDDYLENKDPTNEVPVATSEKDKVGDKVDSVYLRPPPPHKARSAASTIEEESCGMKCLFYTLECCDCVLM